MALPSKFHKDIRVFDLWTEPVELQYKSAKRYRAIIAFDKFRVKNSDGTQYEADSPQLAREGLISSFDNNKLSPESKYKPVVVAGAAQV